MACGKVPIGPGQWPSYDILNGCCSLSSEGIKAYRAVSGYEQIRPHRLLSISRSLRTHLFGIYKYGSFVSPSSQGFCCFSISFLYKLSSSHTQKSSRSSHVCPSSPLIRWLIIFFPSLPVENWRVVACWAKKKILLLFSPLVNAVSCAKKACDEYEWQIEQT